MRSDKGLSIYSDFLCATTALNLLIGYWFIIMLNYLQYFYRAVINVLFVIKEFKYDGKYMCNYTI